MCESITVFSKRVWVPLKGNLTSYPEKNMPTSQPTVWYFQRKEHTNAMSTLYAENKDLAKSPSSLCTLDVEASVSFIQGRSFSNQHPTGSFILIL